MSAMSKLFWLVLTAYIVALQTITTDYHKWCLSLEMTIRFLVAAFCRPTIQHNLNIFDRLGSTVLQ